VLLAMVQVLEELTLEFVVLLEGAALTKMTDERFDDIDVVLLRWMAHDAEMVIVGKMAEKARRHECTSVLHTPMRAADRRGAPGARG